MKDPRTNERLREVLRTGDPAADGSEPTAEERVWLRRLVLNQVPDRSPTWRWLPISATVAALLVVGVILLPTQLANRSDTTDPAISARPEARPGPTSPDRRQQIQFATENGTRIIWVLDDDLTL